MWRDIRVRVDGSLGPQEIFGPDDHGRLIDGIAFDSYGNLWGTYVMTDGIFALTPEGERRVIFDDCSPEEERRFDETLRNGEATPESYSPSVARSRTGARR